MEAIFLWLADEEDPAMQGFPGHTKQFPESTKHGAIEEQTERLVEGCTRGILQVLDAASSSGPCTIDFLHKTTYDWLRETSNWNRILENGPRATSPSSPSSQFWSATRSHWAALKSTLPSNNASVEY